MSGPIRILIADDQLLVLHGLKAVLELEPDLAVVGLARDGHEAVCMARQLVPHVVLMDLRMPVMDGVQSTREIKRSLPDTRVIILTMFDDDDCVLEGLLAGASGYVMKDVSPEELVQAVRAVARGGAIMSPHVASKLLREFNRLAGAAHGTLPAERPAAWAAQPGGTRADAGGEASDGAAAAIARLSPREREILSLIAQGLTNREIAERLVIAEGTVKNHISRILDKLQLRDRAQAAAMAGWFRLVDPCAERLGAGGDR